MSWSCTTLGKSAGIATLALLEGVVPKVGEDEVRVGTRAIGLNYADVFCVQGLYESFNKQVAAGGTHVPGLEFAGEVLEIGSPGLAR